MEEWGGDRRKNEKRRSAVQVSLHRDDERAVPTGLCRVGGKAAEPWPKLRDDGRLAIARELRRRKGCPHLVAPERVVFEQPVVEVPIAEIRVKL